MTFSLFLRTFVIFAYHLGPLRVPQIKKPLKQTVQLLEVTYCLNVLFSFLLLIKYLNISSLGLFSKATGSLLSSIQHNLSTRPLHRLQANVDDRRVQRQRCCPRRRFRSLQMRQSNEGRTPKKNCSEVRQCHETGLRH